MNKSYRNIYTIVIILNIVLVFFNSISFAWDDVDFSDEIEISNQEVNIDQEPVVILHDETDFTTPAPVVEFMNEFVAKSQSEIKTMSSAMNCPTCDLTSSNSTSESADLNTCNSKNDYLNTQLSSAPVQRISEIYNLNQMNGGIKKACILASQKTTLGENQKSFAQCSIGQEKILRSKTIRPCINERYLDLTTQSFNLASQCMNQNKFEIESLFGMMNLESGFHANATSGTGSGGIGQLTSDAIKDINTNELENIRRTFDLNENNQCQLLKQEFLNKDQPMRSSRKLNCDRVSLEKGNPLVNMIYTIAYVQKTKKDLDRFFFNQFTNSFKLTSEELEKLKLDLSIWGHNTGVMGLLVPLKILMKKYKKSGVQDRSRFLAELAEQMKRTPASANSSSSRRKETSNYFPKIQSKLNLIKENFAGGSCLE